MRLGLFPAFFCLVAGLSCGLIFICYSKVLDDNTLTTSTDGSSVHTHQDAFFNRVWGRSYDSSDSQSRQGQNVEEDNVDLSKLGHGSESRIEQGEEGDGIQRHQVGSAEQYLGGRSSESSSQQADNKPAKEGSAGRTSKSEADIAAGSNSFGSAHTQEGVKHGASERERGTEFPRDNPQYADTAGRGSRSTRKESVQDIAGRQGSSAVSAAHQKEAAGRGDHTLRVSVKAAGHQGGGAGRFPHYSEVSLENSADWLRRDHAATADGGDEEADLEDEDEDDLDDNPEADRLRHDSDESQAAAEAHAGLSSTKPHVAAEDSDAQASDEKNRKKKADGLEDEPLGSANEAAFKKLEPGAKGALAALEAASQAKEAGKRKAADEVPHKKGTSVGDLTKQASKDLKPPPAAKREKKQTAEDKKFTSQMKDMLEMESNDKGGESMRMEFLSEEEANARDAEEYNEIKAFGARDEDMVTFLQVRQGPQRMPDELRAAIVKSAREGVPLLTMDLVKSHAKQNTVIVTYANWGYYDFVLNWVSHMRRLNVTNFLVGALDKQTSWGLAALGIPGFQMFPGGDGAIGLTTQEFRSNQETSHRMSRQKIALARLFTDFDIDVVLSDVDTVWLRNPTPYFHNFLTVDILVASDELTTTLTEGDEGLEMPQAVEGPLSIGVLYMRHSPATARFIRAWDDLLAGQIHRVDQLAFNTLITKHTTPLRNPPRNPRLATGPDRAIVVGVLPVGLFMNGHTYFVQSLHEELRVKPYVVHATFQEGGVRGKRHRMREAGLWLDPPAYYDTASNFIKVIPDPVVTPLRTLSDADMIRYHVDSLNKQLAQVRAGIALAVALERILILPKFICFCDRSWIGVEKCRAPGAPDMQLPFTCPLDHVLNPTQFDDELREHGPRVDYREYSFLDNPRLPKSMLVSTAVVVPSDARLTRFQENEIPWGAPRIPVPSGSTDDDIRKELEPHFGVRVLIFADANRTFGGFKDHSWAAVVSKRLGRLQNKWCCGKEEEGALLYGMDSRAAGLMAGAASAAHVL